MRSTPRLLAFATAATLLLVTQFALACLWDRDTLKEEAGSFPGLTEVITGRFERQPPRYYEMRLARVTASLAEKPGNLDELDDAGVACDRLGKNDEAIAWMAKKLEALKPLDPTHPMVKDHWYRYHANLGTFYAHRWLRTGADKANTEDLRLAEENIARAIEINASAHFGREKYQLGAIQWLRSGPSAEGEYASFLRTVVEPDPLNTDRLILPSDIVQGISGLIVLGDAWQSVDVFWALGAALEKRGDSSTALLAQLRLQELMGAGRKSLDPAFGEKVPDMRVDGVAGRYGGEIYPEPRDEIHGYFKLARAEADAWNTKRWEFMEARFSEGKHPDTHPDFWEEWKEESSPPEIPDSMTSSDKAFAAMCGIAGVLVLACARYLIGRRARARKGASAKA